MRFGEDWAVDADSGGKSRTVDVVRLDKVSRSGQIRSERSCRLGRVGEGKSARTEKKWLGESIRRDVGRPVGEGREIQKGLVGVTRIGSGRCVLVMVLQLLPDSLQHHYGACIRQVRQSFHLS